MGSRRTGEKDENTLMIVVTGGAGFIGSNIVATLNARGRSDVVVCDTLGQDGKWQNLRKAQFADFVFPHELDRWLAGRDDVEAVLHMGANSSTTAVDGDEVIETNFRFSLRLLESCTAKRIPLVYASSAAVYGEADQTFRDEIAPEAIRALRPLNLYGWSKRQFDLVVAERIASRAPLPPICVGLRFFNVFGPNEYQKGDMKSVVAKIFPVVQRGEAVQLFKSHRAGIADGDQRRDFIYVKDVVDVALWCLTNEARHGIFNVGTGEARSFRELAEAVHKALGQSPNIAYIDMPEAIRDRYQYFTRASLDHLRQAGYTGRFHDLDAAVEDYVKGYLDQPDPFR